MDVPQELTGHHMRALSRVVILIALLSTKVAAAPYTSLYAFGDSYSDIGARYIDGDGPTAVAYLAEHLGINFTFPQDPDSPGKSLDFAASGAISGNEPGYPGYIINGKHWCCQGMADQVDDFLQRVRSGSIVFNPQDTLFFIAGGLNDKDVPTSITVRNLGRQISLLKEAGAYHISLALLPTHIPYFSALAKRLNPAYRQMVLSLRDKLRVDIRLNNWGPYFDDVMQDPARYGILNTTSRCAGRVLFDEDTTPCEKPNTYYYYHEGHPSTAVHRVVGENLFREITQTSRNSKASYVSRISDPH
jgi:cholinesterase